MTKMICFCGTESPMIKGALYCQNPECAHYLNPVEPYGLDRSIPEDDEPECSDDGTPFHDYNCEACRNVQ